MKKMIARITLLGVAAGVAAGVACFVGCSTPDASSSKSITSEPFGTVDGKPVELYTLRNSKGSEARIMTYGGILVSLKVPDKNGNLGDVVLGFDKVDDYVKSSPYFGALIGRYGNRIGNAQFTLDGVTYHLATNNNGNMLHGGWKGFDKVIWTAHPRTTSKGPQLELQYTSPDGEEGFPGTLKVTAVYTLTDDNALRIDFTATTDKDTVVNLTHHSYFNLAGKGDILGEIVQISAPDTTPCLDSKLIPTGEIRSVEGTPFDFRTPTAIGARIDDKDKQLQYGPGYDHNWVWPDKKPGQMSLMATVTDPTSGRVMQVYSTEPALQFYTGNFLDGTITGKYGWTYQKHAAFCMEPQHYPDSPNHPNFPSTELKPGEVYHNTIIYKFTTTK